MGQITLFPGTALPTPACIAPHVDQVVLVGVAAELEATALPATLVRVSDELGLRYLAEWELTAAGLDPAVWVAPEHACGPGNRLIASTIEGERIEQDAAGALVTGTGVPIGSGRLIAFTSIRHQREQQLERGERAAWLLGRIEDERFELAVHLSAPLLWIYELPQALGKPGIFGGWITAAACIAAGDGSSAVMRDTEPTAHIRPSWPHGS